MQFNTTVLKKIIYLYRKHVWSDFDNILKCLIYYNYDQQTSQKDFDKFNRNAENKSLEINTSKKHFALNSEVDALEIKDIK